jgi:hypothetical protein
MAKATARWSGHKVKFDIESASGHTATIDEAPVFGDDEAMRPTEMLLGALAAGVQEDRDHVRDRVGRQARQGERRKGDRFGLQPLLPDSRDAFARNYDHAPP